MFVPRSTVRISVASTDPWTMRLSFLLSAAVIFVLCILQARGCGISKDDLTKRVVNGKDATPHSWPWMVSLRRNGRHICGGSLIKPNWVITAAHCVAYDITVRAYTIVVGAHSRTGTTQFQKSYNLRQIIKHKGYSRRHLRNDIALLQLETPIDASLHVNVVCLPKAGTRVGPGKKCYLTGWGRTIGGGQIAVILQETLLPVADIHSCSKINGKLLPVDDKTMLCAGGEGVSGGCQGDSGGSFVCKENVKYVLRGVVSWGHHNCRTDHFTVFARVSSFIGWINSEIKGSVSPARITKRPPSSCRDTLKLGVCRLLKYYCTRSSWVRKHCKASCKRC